MADTLPGADAPPRRGRVLAVCGSPAAKGGLGKTPLPEARVTVLGIPGDVHYGPTYWSGSRRQTLPNDRPITVVAAEAVHAACASLGIPPLAPGALGENLHVEGLGDLSDLGAGDVIATPHVVLRVGEQNLPCKNLLHWHPGMMKALLGRRGVITTVLVEGVVRPGEEVEVRRAAAAPAS